MLERAAALSAQTLQSVAELERRVIDADGGRLKLEWGRLRGRSGERVEDLLWWEEDRLLGFLGLYPFGSSLELAGMVAPDARRRGIATALLDAAAPLWRALAALQVLLIVPRSSIAGKHLALRRGGKLEHSEHALVQHDVPTRFDGPSALTLRQAGTADVPLIARLLELGFGSPAPELADRPQSPQERTVVIELSGSPIGTAHLTRDGNDAGIYGFVIDPSSQGRGLGRDALRLMCEQLHAEGARKVHLEVAVENDRALQLYTSSGFVAVATEDYYALPVGD